MPPDGSRCEDACSFAQIGCFLSNRILLVRSDASLFLRGSSGSVLHNALTSSNPAARCWHFFEMPPCACKIPKGSVAYPALRSLMDVVRGQKSSVCAAHPALRSSNHAERYPFADSMFPEGARSGQLFARAEGLKVDGICRQTKRVLMHLMMHRWSDSQS